MGSGDQPAMKPLALMPWLLQLPFNALMTNMHWVSFIVPAVILLLPYPTIKACLFVCIVIVYIPALPRPRRKGPFKLLKKYILSNSVEFDAPDGRTASRTIASPAIVAIHPHGMFGLGHWTFFADPAFSNSIIMTASQSLYVPLYRFLFLLSGGVAPATKTQFVNSLKRKQSVLLVPGGVKEMLMCAPNEAEIHICVKHKGFLRIALEHGVPVHPSFAFGCNDLYAMLPFVAYLNRLTYRLSGIPLPPVYTSSTHYWLPWSANLPVGLVVGQPLAVSKVENPTAEMVDALHQEYCTALMALYEKHKAAYNHGHRKLVLHHD
eukprot:NODE_981_length_1113_cov_303.450188_g679_i0.p1 GENE.NODE_981_length_1113_cov_303.450188_g679_i0~~NODE_981_length_1113_cov_303.450188_g679_i0.p1  ORF type:complete len:340 (-),score=89.73 NODE_981_length_1113_cov_303.450188_g679_i0:93-1055(-)